MTNTHFNIVTTFITYGARAYNLSSPQTMCVLSLLNHRDMFSGYCCPSQSMMCLETGISKQETVSINIKKAIEAGVPITITKKHNPTTGKFFNTYWFDIDEMMERLNSFKPVESAELENPIDTDIIVEAHPAEGNPGNTTNHPVVEPSPFGKPPKIEPVIEETKGVEKTNIFTASSFGALSKEANNIAPDLGLNVLKAFLGTGLKTYTVEWNNTPYTFNLE